MNRTDAPTEVVRRIVDAGGVALAVREWGAPDAPPVVLLHGFPESGDTWAAVAERLVAAGRRVVAPDLRGHGRSDAPRRVAAYGSAPTVADAVAVLRHVADVGGAPVDVAGHDWGGGVVWRLVDRDPSRVRRAVVLNAPHPDVLVDAVLRDRDQRRRSWYVLAAQLPVLPEVLLGRGDGDALAALLRATHTDDEIAELRRCWRRPGVRRGMLHWYRAALRERVVAGRRSGGSATDGRVPVTVGWGTADPLFGAGVLRGSLARYPSARLVELDGLGHAPHREAPGRVAALLLETFADDTAPQERAS